MNITLSREIIRVTGIWESIEIKKKKITIP